MADLKQLLVSTKLYDEYHRLCYDLCNIFRVIRSPLISPLPHISSLSMTPFKIAAMAALIGSVECICSYSYDMICVIRETRLRLFELMLLAKVSVALSIDRQLSVAVTDFGQRHE